MNRAIAAIAPALVVPAAADNAAVRFVPREVPVILDYFCPGSANLPPELESRLGPVPAGCRRMVMDTRALLIRDATNVVLDILHRA